MQHTLVQCYQTLRAGQHLDQQILAYLQEQEVASFQLASLAVQLIQGEITADELKILAHIFETFPQIASYVNIAFPENKWVQELTTSDHPVDESLSYILQNTSRERSIGSDSIKTAIDKFTSDQICLDFMATWLMTICFRGLSTEDLETMTFAMRDTGKIYDYRNLPNNEHTKIIRRYPTGALSEKTALILPSLLSAVSDQYPIASPFLVARSLGFTGGTWDKLKAIPNFVFPQPGDESIAVMNQCSVAMSVTLGDFNPADRKMYQFRSITGTIESHELIIASIASKMLALPADHLLMDVRYGDGAFIATYEDAQRLGTDLSQLISKGGVPCTFHLTDTAQPNGCAIGNALEVLEALAVMNKDFESKWDIRSINEQRDIILGFFELLMNYSFGESKEYWRTLGEQLFEQGKVFESFLNILQAHKVDSDTIEQIKINPSNVIGPKTTPVQIAAKTVGTLRRIDQKKLGNIINFHLGGGGNDFVGEFTPNAGVILTKRLGDTIVEGEPLCFLHQSEQNTITEQSKIYEELVSCFEIR